MTRYTKLKVERFSKNPLSSHQAMKAIDLNSVVKINSFFSNKCTTTYLVMKNFSVLTLSQIKC